jgi:hypothetical protein
MRVPFDKAVRVVEKAAKAGLAPATDQDALLRTGSPAAIAAFRALGPAAAELDRIASLRSQMTSIAGHGVVDHLLASLLTGLTDEEELEQAEQVWQGEVEVVTVNVKGGIGSHQARVRRARLGGAWLGLVLAGFTLQVRTADESVAMVRGLRSSPPELDDLAA